MKMLKLARLFVAVAFPILALRAQTNTPSAPGADALGSWIGVAHSSVPGVFGHAKGRDLALAAVRWRHAVVQSSSYSIDYVLDVLPVAFVSTPLSANTSPPGGNCQGGTLCVLRAPFAGQRAVFGAGAMPFGFQFRVAPHARLQPFASASGGLLWFTDRIPDREAARLNFAAEVGAGAVAVLTPRLGLLFGYMFHHLSNGGTAPSNPGIDSHLFYVGVARSIRRD